MPKFNPQQTDYAPRQGSNRQACLVVFPTNAYPDIVTRTEAHAKRLGMTRSALVRQMVMHCLKDMEEQDGLP